jgi:cytochrome c peroxidase
VIGWASGSLPLPASVTFCRVFTSELSPADTVGAWFDSSSRITMFEDSFDNRQVTFDKIVKALASYVRSLTSFASPFDEYAYQNNDDAMSDAAKRGMELFFSEQFECFHCHGGFNFTQSSQHETQA